MKNFMCNFDKAVADTEKGKVRGFFWDEVYTFRGIPYAKAERFHKPVQVEPWDGIFDATNYGYTCPLLTPVDRPSGELLVPHRYWPMDEDCLNLNIWTPGIDNMKRPVLFWIHGGAYEGGSSIEQFAMDGRNLCYFGDVVVVTINHRVNILGYLDLSDFGEEYANSGNRGGEDIIAALTWVKNNIAAFGGDPDNVTLFGQSGGGAKITTLLQTPAADGLYSKGVIMSGVTSLLPDATGSGKMLAEAMMKELSVQSVQEMEKTEYQLLAKAYLKVKPILQEQGAYVGCCPHPNAYYAGDPLVNGFRKETSQIPILTGTVFAEFAAFFAPVYNKYAMTEEEQKEQIILKYGEENAEGLVKLFKTAFSDKEEIDIVNTDLLFRAPQIHYVKERSVLNNQTYSYMFCPDMGLYGGLAPWHCSDIPYFFHNIDLVEYAHGTPEISERLQEELSGSLLAFARTGNPNHGDMPHWDSCRPGSEYVMVFNRQTEQRVNFDHALIQALSDVMSGKRFVLDEKNAKKIQH